MSVHPIASGTKTKGAYLTWHNVYCMINNVPILASTSGFCKPGKSLAILGPSGAGKSTLLDVIAGRKNNGNFGGDIRINGSQSNRHFSQRTGYVTSDDISMDVLTVFETLLFAARCRLPHYLTDLQRIERVEFILAQMNLTSVRDQRVGSILVRGLSTGERKRVQIAIELIPNSEVLFLDECTTGLDSSIANTIVNHVLTVGKQRNMAIVLCIHQPSSQIFSMFDDLIFIAKGETLYFGPNVAAESYFSNIGSQYQLPKEENAADFLLEAISVNADELINHWKSSSERANLELKVEKLNSRVGSVLNFSNQEEFKDSCATPLFVQIMNLSRRTLTYYTRNSVMTWARFIFMVLIALVNGMLFYNLGLSEGDYRARSLFFFSQVVVINVSSLANASSFIRQRKLYYQEISAGFYTPVAYFSVAAVIELVMMLLLAVVYSIISYSLTGMDGSNLGFNILLCMDMAWFGSAVTLFSATVSPAIPAAIAIWCLIFLYNVLFSAYLISEAYIQSICFVCHSFLRHISAFHNFIVSVYYKEFWDSELICNDAEKIAYDLDPIMHDMLTFLVDKIRNETIAAGNPSDETETDFVNNVYNKSFASWIISQATTHRSRFYYISDTTAPSRNEWLSGWNELANRTQTGLQLALNGITGTALDKIVANAITAVGIQSLLDANVTAEFPDSSTCAFPSARSYLLGYIGTTYGILDNPDTLEDESTAMIDYSNTGGLIFFLGVILFIASYAALRLLRFQKK